MHFLLDLHMYVCIIVGFAGWEGVCKFIFCFFPPTFFFLGSVKGIQPPTQISFSLKTFTLIVPPPLTMTTTTIHPCASDRWRQTTINRSPRSLAHTGYFYINQSRKLQCVCRCCHRRFRIRIPQIISFILVAWHGRGIACAEQEEVGE